MIALASAYAATSALAQTSGTWLNNSDPASWSVVTHWSSGAYPTGGGTATFGPNSNALQVTLDVPVSLSAVNFTDPAAPAITGSSTLTLSLAGASTINADNSFAPAVFRGYQVTTTSPAATLHNLNSINAPFATAPGSNGFTKTGNSLLTLTNSTNTIASTNLAAGTLAVTSDGALGATNNAVNFSGSAVLWYAGNTSNARTYSFAPGVTGQIWWIGEDRTLALSGSISGSGTFVTNGLYTSHPTTGLPSTTALAQISTASATFTGTLRHDAGTLSLGGAMPNATAVYDSGTLILTNGTTRNRIGDSTPVTLRGGALAINNTLSTAYNETAGTLTLASSNNFIDITPGSGNNTVFTFASLARSQGATVAFRAASLGSNGNAVALGNGTSLLTGGIIPFAYVGNYNPRLAAASSHPENENNLLATYGVNGVTPITSYANSFTGSTSSTNVQLLVPSATASIDIGSGTTNVNALVLAAQNTRQAAAFQLTGSGTININSGVLLNANAGLLADGSRNAVTGNVISANLNFGAAEAIIHKPSALTITGAIGGSGGLTASGPRTLTLSGASTYTGTTRLSGLVRFNGNVYSDGSTPSPFGLSTSPIELIPGGVASTDPTDGSTVGSPFAVLAKDAGTGPIFFARPITARANGSEAGVTTAVIRNLGTAGNGTLALTGTLTIDTGATFTLQGIGGDSADVFNVAGPIAGAGRLITDVANNSPNFAAYLPNANTFTGGFIGEGTVILGNSNALGAGSVMVNGDGREALQLSTSTAGLTIPNNFDVTLGTLGVFSPTSVTFSGGIRSNVRATLDITSTAGLRVGGPLTGSTFVKAGAGTLTLSGSNSFAGDFFVGQGNTPGGVVVALSRFAFGAANAGGVFVNGGSLSTLVISYSGNPFPITGKTLTLAGFDESGNLNSGVGVNGGGALQLYGIGSEWDGPILLAGPSSIGVNGSGRVGTITTSSATANSGTLTKLGTGRLAVSRLGTNTVPLDGVTISAGTIILLGTSTNTTRTLTLATGTSLDVSASSLVVDYAGTSPLGTLSALVSQGYAGGAWTGTGINSATAAMTTGTAVGIIEASDFATSTFRGVPLTDSTAVLIRYTYAGDANLSGSVDSIDFNALATHFGQNSARWAFGDTNFDGTIDTLDFAKLIANFGRTALGAADVPAANASVGAVVPEPTGVAVIALATSLLRRKRSRPS